MSDIDARLSDIDAMIAELMAEPMRQPSRRSTRDEKTGAQAELKVVDDLADQYTGDRFADTNLISAENDRTNTKTGTGGPPFREPTYEATILQKNRYNQIIAEKEDRERRARIEAFRETPEGRREQAETQERDRRLDTLADEFFEQEFNTFLDEEIRRVAERELRIRERIADLPPPPPEEAGGKEDDPVMRSDMDALIFDPVKGEFTGIGGASGPKGVVEKAFAKDYGLDGIRDIMNLEQREKGKPYGIPDEKGRKVSSNMLAQLLRLEGVNVFGKASRIDLINAKAQKIFGTQVPEDVGRSTREGMETLLFGRQVGSTPEFRAEREGRGVRRVVFNRKFYKDFYKKLYDYHQANK